MAEPGQGRMAECLGASTQHDQPQEHTSGGPDIDGAQLCLQTRKRGLAFAYANSSRRALASWRSAVSKPSVNQL
jgi:hypothetical protein